jgi:hypothetical protein
MLKVGSRRTWSPVERGASKRRAAPDLAEARTLYPSVAAAMPAPARNSAVECSKLVGGGVGEADLQRVGEVERWRWLNRAAPAKLHDGGVGRERADAGEISSRWGIRVFATRCHAL